MNDRTTGHYTAAIAISAAEACDAAARTLDGQAQRDMIESATCWRRIAVRTIIGARKVAA